MVLNITTIANIVKKFPPNNILFNFSEWINIANNAR